MAKYERPKKFLIATLLIAMAVSLTSCVYLRLLRFKNQLKNFDQNVVVQTTHGLSFKLLKPIIEPGDLVFITESRPTRKRIDPADPDHDIWIWRFDKKMTDANTPYSIEFATHFRDDLLTRLDFDENLVELIPPEFFVSILKSLGAAKISKLRKTVTANVKAKKLKGVELPTLHQIMDTMGPPTQQSLSRSETTKTYAYQFQFKNPDNGTVAGQFSITFAAEADDPTETLTGFTLTAKGR